MFRPTMKFLESMKNAFGGLCKLFRSYPKVAVALSDKDCSTTTTVNFSVALVVLPAAPFPWDVAQTSLPALHWRHFSPSKVSNCLAG